jgi:hypothetical protein
MEGVAMTTQGPTSSNCAADLRCAMCLNWKGFAVLKAALMSSFIISMYVLYTLLARRARPLACRGWGVAGGVAGGMSEGQSGGMGGERSRGQE